MNLGGIMELVDELSKALPQLRGRLTAGASLAEITWFRVGGPAEVLLAPADEADLAYALAGIDPAIPVTVIGLGSNLLVRDGGVDGVVIRLGRGFNEVTAVPGNRLRAGTAVPDQMFARTSATHALAGFEFYRGIPGAIGGALRMNAGAHGRETKDCLVEAVAIDRQGRRHVLSLADLGYTYRHSGAADDLIFTSALYQGTPGDRENRCRDGGGRQLSRNPPAGEGTHRRFHLQESAGEQRLETGRCRRTARLPGRRRARVEKHCNFLINDEEASGEDIERLGETVRARVKAQSGVTLDWEIIRLGKPLPGHGLGEALAL